MGKPTVDATSSPIPPQSCWPSNKQIAFCSVSAVVIIVLARYGFPGYGKLPAIAPLPLDKALGVSGGVFAGTIATIVVWNRFGPTASDANTSLKHQALTPLAPTEQARSIRLELRNAMKTISMSKDQRGWSEADSDVEQALATLIRLYGELGDTKLDKHLRADINFYAIAGEFIRETSEDKEPDENLVKGQITRDFIYFLYSLVKQSALPRGDQFLSEVCKSSSEFLDNLQTLFNYYLLDDRDRYSRPSETDKEGFVIDSVANIFAKRLGELGIVLPPGITGVKESGVAAS